MEFASHMTWFFFFFFFKFYFVYNFLTDIRLVDLSVSKLFVCLFIYFFHRA